MQIGLSSTTTVSEEVDYSSDLFPKIVSRGYPNFPLTVKNSSVCILFCSARNTEGEKNHFQMYKKDKNILIAVTVVFTMRETEQIVSEGN